MGSKTNRKSNPIKAHSSASKQRISVEQAVKKRYQKWSKHRSERVRDALNRDANLLYEALENPSPMPPAAPQTDSVVSLAESMLGLGK